MDEQPQPEAKGNNDYTFDVGNHIEELGFGFLFFRYLFPIVGFLFFAFTMGLLIIVIVRGG